MAAAIEFIETHDNQEPFFAYVAFTAPHDPGMPPMPFREMYERWKLIVYPKIGHAQLFDLQTDPHEITNLVDRPEHAPQVARLRLLMQQWQARVGDALEIPDSHKQPGPIDLTGRPRVPDPWQPEWIVKKYFDL